MSNKKNNINSSIHESDFENNFIYNDNIFSHDPEKYSNLELPYNSIIDKKTDSIYDAIQNNEIYAPYMEKCNQQILECEKIMNEQVKLDKALTEFDNRLNTKDKQSRLISKEVLNEFLEDKLKKINNLEMTCDELVELSKKNRDRYNKFTLFCDDLADESIVNNLRKMDTYLKTFLYAKEILEGKDN